MLLLYAPWIRLTTPLWMVSVGLSPDRLACQAGWAGMPTNSTNFSSYPSLVLVAFPMGWCGSPFSRFTWIMVYSLHEGQMMEKKQGKQGELRGQVCRGGHRPRSRQLGGRIRPW